MWTFLRWALFIYYFGIAVAFQINLRLENHKQTGSFSFGADELSVGLVTLILPVTLPVAALVTVKELTREGFTIPA